MIYLFDEDIKIAHIGESKKTSQNDSEYHKNLENGNIDKAKKVGEAIAADTVSSAALEWTEETDTSFEIQLQRGLLLAFSAVVAIESAALPTVIEDVIKQKFFSSLQKLDSGMYKETAESGAFSFYYLAYRRGTELERRVGQTFAMLCAHDGDPIYQELGETLFCWMKSKTEKLLADSGIM